MGGRFSLGWRSTSRCGRSCNYDLGFCFDMRAIWKGSIAFGLVHIPVNLYPATETQSISSNLLHKKDHSRIRYQRIFEATGKEVPAEEIVRGYEVERDNFVVISDDELKEASPEKSAAIEIQEFVNESQIPTLYFEKPYYLEPDKGAGKAYALRKGGMKKIAFAAPHLSSGSALPPIAKKRPMKVKKAHPKTRGTRPQLDRPMHGLQSATSAT